MKALPILGALLLLPCPARADQEAMWTWSTRAVGLVAEGKHAEAVAALGQANKALPSPELDAMVGLASLAGGRPKLCLSLLRAAVKRGSTEPLVFYWAGRAALAAGKRAEALRGFNRAIAVGGDRPAFRMAQAILLKETGKGALARGALARVCAATPNLLDPSLYPTPVEGTIDLLGVLLRKFPHKDQLARTRAHMLWRAGRAYRARQELAALARRNPRDASVLALLARAQAALGMRDEAMASAVKAAALAPESGAVLSARGELLLQAGEAARAVADLKIAADQSPRDAGLLLRLALACQEAEDTKCARRFFGHALGRDRTLAPAHFGLALLDQEAGKVEEARRSFARALVLAPANARYYRTAAQLESLQKKKRRVKALLAEARRAERLARRQVKSDSRNQAVAREMRRMMDGLEAGKACKGPCQRHLKRLPGVVGRFARLHVAHHYPRQIQLKEATLGPVLGKLKSDKLLRTDPTGVDLKGRTASGKTYMLKKSYVFVPLEALR